MINNTLRGRLLQAHRKYLVEFSDQEFPKAGYCETVDEKVGENVDLEDPGSKSKELDMKLSW